MRRIARVATLIAALVIAGVAAAQSAGPPPSRIRGEIVSLNGDTLTVHRRSGDSVTISVKPDVEISAVRNIKLSEIKKGAFIGTAAKTDSKGHLIAQEVVVFPESERGTGEGHYAWDLGPHSTMTNANVDQVFQGATGNDLHLSYKGGSNTVTVPPNVPVVAFIPAERSDIVAGKKVFVIASKDSAGHFVAHRVVVEKDGVAPPM